MQQGEFECDNSTAAASLPALGAWGDLGDDDSVATLSMPSRVARDEFGDDDSVVTASMPTRLAIWDDPGARGLEATGAAEPARLAHRGIDMCNV